MSCITYTHSHARACTHTHIHTGHVAYLSKNKLHILTFLYRGCKLTQFYGYSKDGDKRGILYDAEWKTHTYFLSSQETGFQLSMLQNFDIELLIGQVSYKQRAEIYNVCNGYDNAKKKRKQNVSTSTYEHTEDSQQDPQTAQVSELCR